MSDESKKVYIVTEGTYSDYGIVAVFSTLEKAEEFMNDFPDVEANGGDVEEWPLDEMYQKIPIGKSIWGVDMVKDGCVIRAYQQPSCPFSVSHMRAARIVKERVWTRADEKYATTLKVDVFAKDETHAVKIANEKRAYLVAHNLFVDGYCESRSSE